MFRLFERLVDPFPREHTGRPPTSIFRFCRHYSRGVTTPLLIMTALSTLLAIFEVSLFGFLGQLVDWLAAKSPDTLLRDEWPTLLRYSLLVLVVLPALVVLQSLVVHQALMGNFPMIVRWQAHRYLMRQSLAFFQDEFAGRIATKLMQTSLAVREAVMKLMDILVYVGVYFLSIVVLVASADLRMSVPLLLWLVAYVLVLRVFVPRLKSVSERQADARSMMTGRIVDSYTNITTVKLFSHARREAAYAREGMQEFLDTVHPQMRLVTALYAAVWGINALLVFSVAALSINLWLQQAVSTGSIAIAIALCLRLNGMSQWIMWEVASLFENIGTVRD
ncbi:MAG: ABC transporter ATP-binding protein, partial [Gammaproteobacteria bacterium]|nr:ABC transporter ATP-binding protein [Gammaproteobacteria bacterium]